MIAVRAQPAPSRHSLIQRSSLACVTPPSGAGELHCLAIEFCLTDRAVAELLGANCVAVAVRADSARTEQRQERAVDCLLRPAIGSAQKELAYVGAGLPGRSRLRPTCRPGASPVTRVAECRQRIGRASRSAGHDRAPRGRVADPEFREQALNGILYGLLDRRRGLLWHRTTAIVQLLSRNGRDLGPHFPELVQAGQTLPAGTLIDGEIVIADDDGGGVDFGALQARLTRARAHLSRTAPERPAVLVVRRPRDRRLQPPGGAAPPPRRESTRQRASSRSVGCTAQA